MTLRRFIVWLVVRAYPGTWRKEYGEELRSMLLSQPLTASALGDVLLNAVRQHVRNPTACQIGFLCILLWRCFCLVWSPANSPSDVWWAHFVQVDRIVIGILLFATSFCEVRRSGDIYRGDRGAFDSWWLGTLIPNLIAVLAIASGLGDPGPALHHVLHTRSSTAGQVISDFLFFITVSSVGAIAGKVARKWYKPDTSKV